jgi:plastocyanin
VNFRLALAAGLLILAQCRPAAPPPRRYLVEIRQMAFVPESLTVAPGDTVVWVNRDFLPHTSTSALWDTTPLPQDGSGQFVATGTGEVPYHCAFHPTMLGRLIIRARTP